MPGTFNGKTLVISATPTAGAKIVDAGAATNVAGITISGDTMYSVKTSGKVTTLYKTPDDTNADAEAVNYLCLLKIQRDMEILQRL